MAIFRTSSSRRPRRLSAISIAVCASLALTLTPSGAQGLVQIADEDDEHLDDLDTRLDAAAIAPTTPQLEAVEELGATARWTQFGTAQS